MTPSLDLAEILRLHALWIGGDEEGRYAHLEGADLRDLRGAHLQGAYLQGAVLRGAFEGVHLEGAVLSHADLSRAHLEGAHFRGAELTGARLVYLEGAHLEGAHLEGAHFEGAVLVGTCLDPDAPVPPISDAQIEAAGLEVVGDRLCGWRTYRSTHVGASTYEPGEHVAPWFSVDVTTACHPGVYIWGRVRAEAWLAKNPVGERLVRCSALRSECVAARDKIRAKRIFVEET